MQKLQEMQAQSLGWEDPLEKGMATHSSIPAWEIPWTEEPSRLQRVRQDLGTEEQGRPGLLCSSVDGGPRVPTL